MSRYTFSTGKKEDRPWKIHPIWRGIGCVWLILLPIMAYAAASLFVREILFKNQLPTLARYIPAEFYTQVYIPTVQIGSFYIDLNFLHRWLPGQPLYYSDVLFTLTFIFLGFGIGSIVYAILYRLFGPPKSPYEAIEERRYRGPLG
jgi:hypothetical protein